MLSIKVLTIYCFILSNILFDFNEIYTKNNAFNSLSKILIDILGIKSNNWIDEVYDYVYSKELKNFLKESKNSLNNVNIVIFILSNHSY